MSCLVSGARRITSGSPTFASLCRTSPSHHPLSTLSRIFPRAGARFSTQLIVSMPSPPFFVFLSPSSPSKPEQNLPPINFLCVHSPLFYIVLTCLASRSLGRISQSAERAINSKSGISNPTIAPHLRELCSFVPLLRPPPTTSFLSIQDLISEYVSLGMTCSRSSHSIVFTLVAVSFAFPPPIPTLVIDHTWFVSQYCPSIVFTFCSLILRRICPLLVTSP